MKHKTGTRKQWLSARLKLLQAEKELTRLSDKLALRRQKLPWVRIQKNYQFQTEEGNASLADLFKGRSQLLIYHFMFGPDYTAGCPACSAIADGFNGFEVHLANHDVTLSAVSRAPLTKLRAYKERMGWTFPWASSLGSDFNSDFNVWFTEEQQRKGGIEYNYVREKPIGNSRASKTAKKGQSRDGQGGEADFAAMAGTDTLTYARERPGMSSFVLEDGVIYHTYSTYARGLDVLWGMYQWLDRAPRGRNETGLWFRRHDEYDKS
ncbi:MAG TPA: thioredoxin family protein [Nitrososphaeraceae archaeon]|nr:thioredoxin family protein [Nitrososphaeraceae archaeon]